MPWPSGRTAHHRARGRWRHPLKRLVSRLVPFGGRRGHRRSRSSRARSVATSRSTFTACLAQLHSALRRTAALRLGRHRLRLGLRFRRFWSGAPRSGGGSSQAINLPCRSQRVITRESFPRRQTSTIERLRTLLLNSGVRWVRRSHVAPPLLRCFDPGALTINR